jgi:hypothetical protein
MSKLETPMIIAYWETVGGTLIEEFQMVKGDAVCGPRRADAVILPNRDRIRLPIGQRSISIEGEDIIIVQAKAYRLGMYLMGQAVLLLCENHTGYCRLLWGNQGTTVPICKTACDSQGISTAGIQAASETNQEGHASGPVQHPLIYKSDMQRKSFVQQPCSST